MRFGLDFSGCSSVWQSTWFGTRGSRVRVMLPRPAQRAQQRLSSRSNESVHALVLLYIYLRWLAYLWNTDNEKRKRQYCEKSCVLDTHQSSTTFVKEGRLYWIYFDTTQYAGVAEWQTRQSQELVSSTCGFKSHHQHHLDRYSNL